MLQDGDSFFPSGAVSFSWGLETLCAEEAVRGERDLESYLLAHLEGRWAHFDRPVVVAAATASATLSLLVEIDQIVEAQTLAAELRSGSRRNGRALLAVHERLETAGARDYMQLVYDGQGRGHLAAMQGFLWARRGIPSEDAAVLSAHVACTGLLGAAVRIGVIGHVAAQRLLRRAHHHIAAIMLVPPVDLDNIHAFMPQADIASMRHEMAQVRLFAN
jgi:urease accessory protein